MFRNRVGVYWPQATDEQERLRTRRDAESALHEFILYVEGGGDPSPERISVADYLGRWLYYQRTRGIRPRTLDGYEGYIRREIAPVIGGLDVTEVRCGHIRPC